jgi:type I restriction enzyme, S subunit
MTSEGPFPKERLGDLLRLEYGVGLPERDREGALYRVFGSNGPIGSHSAFLVSGPGVVVGRKGSVGEVQWSADPFWPIDTTYYAVPRNSSNLRWLYWLLRSSNLKRLDAATGVPGLNRNDVYSLTVHTPPPTDQDRIAAVLDLVDEAIAKTEAVITKLKQVRAGLLHDLLARGIDENGELRDPIAHPEQFREELGLTIPKPWTLRCLRQCLRGNPQNGIYKPARDIGRGVLLIGQTSINDDRTIDVSKARRAEVSSSELQRFGLNSDDILISRVFATLEGLGLPAIVPKIEEKAVYESNMMRLLVDAGVIAPRFLFEQLRARRVRARIISAAQLSNQASINQPAPNAVPICIPEPSEQSEIVERISALDNSVMALVVEHAKLLGVKSGLTEDLLSGRVRVPQSVFAAEVRA